MEELTRTGGDTRTARTNSEAQKLRKAVASYLRENFERILEDIDLQVTTSLPEYESLSAETTREIRRSFADFLSLYIEHFESNEFPIKRLKALATEAGSKRSLEGLSLGAVIDGFETGESFVWKTVTRELLSEDHSPAAWIELSNMRERFTRLARRYMSRAYRIQEQSAVKKQLEELKVISGLGQAIVSMVELERVLGQILEVATSILQVRMGMIMMLDERGQYLQPVVEKGFASRHGRAGRLPVEKTIAGLAIKRGEYILALDDELLGFEMPQHSGAGRIRSVLSIPIKVDDQVIGVIELYDTMPRVFTDLDITMMMAFSPQAGIAIKNAKLFREERRRRKQATVLAELALAINEAKNLDELLDRVAEKTAQALGADRCSIFFYDPGAHSLTFMTGYGRSTLQTWLLHQFHIPMSQLGKATTRAIRLRKPVFVSEPEMELSLESRIFRSSKASAYLQVPIVLKDDLIGLMSYEFSGEETVLSDEELTLAESMASQVAVAVQNRKLQQKIFEQQVELRNAEINERLYREREKIEAVLRATPDAVFLIDRDMRVQLLNPAAEFLTGWDLSEARGKTCHEILFGEPVPGNVCPDPGCPISRVLMGENVSYSENQIVTRSGRKIPSGGTFAPIFGPDGSIESVVVIYRDISEQKELQRYALMQREMDIASGIQTSLLPKEKLLAGGVVVYGYQKQARMVGGDWYDYWGHQDRLFIVVGDASGSGVGAALLATMAMSAIRVEAREHSHILEIMNHVNQALYSTHTPENFVTVFFGVLDLMNMTLRYSNAGHEEPLLIGAESRHPEPLSSGKRSLLGAFPGLELDVSERRLNSGERLVLYTDGVIVAKNPKGREFGLRRLSRFLAANRDLPPEEFVDALIESILDFSEGEIRDDMTVLVCDIP